MIYIVFPGIIFYISLEIYNQKVVFHIIRSMACTTHFDMSSYVHFCFLYCNIISKCVAMFGFLLEVIYIVEERRDESWKVIYIYDTISYNIYIIIILREKAF